MDTLVVRGGMPGDEEGGDTREVANASAFARAKERVRGVRKAIGGVFEAYTADAGDAMPLSGYAALMAAFGGMAAVTLAGLSRRGKLPKRYGVKDVVLFGIATHKLTRILTRDWVTSPLRAPFTKYVESDGAGEVKEASRGTGLRRAIGDLATCQFCAGPWVASGMLASSLVAPRPTRFVATMLAIVTTSDFLHHVYARTKKLSE
jgi:hypothetical protein